MATHEEVTVVIHWLMARYPNSNWPESTITAWLEDLADVPADALRAAARTWYDAPHTWPPNGGELRAAARDIMTGSDDGWESGWQAWKQHLKDCRAPEYLCRHDRSEIFDPVTHHTVEAIGWQTLCRMDQDQEATIRAQFRDIWKATAQRQADKARRHPAVQQVMDTYRQQLEAHDAPRIEAPVTTPRGNGQSEVTGTVGDIDAKLRGEGRPRRAEFDAAVARIAAQKRGGTL